jgi:POT family proton-dependent oligopeptide transporter
MSLTTLNSGAKQSHASWFGQPSGLTILFLTEMWEKFSFFGMRALLVYYMVKHLRIEQNQASLIYGYYTAFVYFTPIFGGAISDRWLGRKRAIVIGGLIMAAGHFMMTFDSLLYAGLVAIALGNGLFLPNLPSQIGSLYEADDPRRASAYNIYYVGINLGAFLAPLICGTLGELYGWHYGFAAAGVGMCLGLVIYCMGGRHLPPDSRLKGNTPGTRELNAPNAAAMSSRTLLVLFAVFLSVVVFRGAYEQEGNTIALWADANVDRSALAFTIPATWFQSLNPLLVFLLTPILVARWNAAARNGRDFSSLHKMAIGALGVAMAFVLVACVSLANADSGQKPGWLWLAAFFFLLTLSELYILPVGLGLFARLAPQRFAATTIAAWYFAAFAGNLLAGYLGAYWDVIEHSTFFLSMAAVAGVSALMLWGIEGRVSSMENFAHENHSSHA